MREKDLTLLYPNGKNIPQRREHVRRWIAQYKDWRIVSTHKKWKWVIIEFKIPTLYPHTDKCSCCDNFPKTEKTDGKK